MRVLSVFIFCLAFSLGSVAQVSLINSGYSSYANPVGGKEEIQYIVHNEINLPEKFLDKSFDSTVVVSFTVGEDGIARGFKVLRSGSELVDNEVLRILRLIEWQPAIYMEKPTETFQNLTFRITGKKLKRWYKNRGYGYEDNYPADTITLITEKPQVPASYIDGNSLFGEFFLKNIRYPGEAKSKNISGEVHLSFVIEKRGYPSNFKVVRSLSGGCDQEAVRVLKLTRWNPAIINGKPVRTRITLPVTFMLDTQLINGISNEQKRY